MKNISYQNYLNYYAAFDNFLLSYEIKSVEENCVFEVISKEGNIRAFWQILDWDSDILGVKSARINNVFIGEDVSENKIQHFLKLLNDSLKKHDVKFVFFRFNANQFNWKIALESDLWTLADEMNIYFADSDLEFYCAHIPNVFIKEIETQHAISFFKSEKRIFEKSRMYADTRIDNLVADDFYAKLFESVINRNNAVQLGIYSGVNDLLGFVVGTVDEDFKESLDLDLLYLWQICVASDFRGKGFSKVLLLKFLEKAFKVSRFVEIGTQKSNVPANTLYRSFGLKLVSEALTFHKWL